MTRQDYQTPPDFMTAVVARFGPIGIDLAGTADNAQAPLVITPDHDSLTVDWAELNCARWLNPPYAHVRPWVRGCAALADDPHTTLLLVLASVGAGWWADHVEGKALVLFCRPRLRFVGETQDFNRDLALCVYGRDHAAGYAGWAWKECR